MNRYTPEMYSKVNAYIENLRGDLHIKRNVSCALQTILDLKTPLCILERHEIEVAIEPHLNNPSTSKWANEVKKYINDLKEKRKLEPPRSPINSFFSPLNLFQIGNRAKCGPTVKKFNELPESSSSDMIGNFAAGHTTENIHEQDENMENHRKRRSEESADVPEKKLRQSGDGSIAEPSSSEPKIVRQQKQAVVIPLSDERRKAIAQGIAAKLSTNASRGRAAGASKSQSTMKKATKLYKSVARR